MVQQFCLHTHIQPLQFYRYCPAIRLCPLHTNRHNCTWQQCLMPSYTWHNILNIIYYQHCKIFNKGELHFHHLCKKCFNVSSVTSCFQTNSVGYTEEYIHQSGSFKRLMNQVLGESEYWRTHWKISHCILHKWTCDSFVNIKQVLKTCHKGILNVVYNCENVSMIYSNQCVQNINEIILFYPQ